jgi:type IV secretion system protein VirB5
MSQTKDFNEAKQLFFAQFGNALVTNTYLKIALAGVSLIALGLLLLNFRTHQIVRNFKPLVIRIDQIGRAEAVAYQNLTYKPQDVEMKYFLSQFCKLHYARNRATLKGQLLAVALLCGRIAGQHDHRWLPQEQDSGELYV